MIDDQFESGSFDDYITNLVYVAVLLAGCGTFIYVGANIVNEVSKEINLVKTFIVLLVYFIIYWIVLSWALIRLKSLMFIFHDYVEFTARLYSLYAPVHAMVLSFLIVKNFPITATSTTALFLTWLTYGLITDNSEKGLKYINEWKYTGYLNPYNTFFMEFYRRR